MNSGYIRSLLQKIRKVHKGAAGLAPMLVMLIFFMCIFLSLVFRKGVLQYDYERLDSGLTYALLAGAVINLEEYAVSGNIIIADSTRPEIGDSTFMHSYYHFLDSLRVDLGLDEGMNFTGTPGLGGNVEVVEYKVYNYIRDAAGWHVTECGITGGQMYVIEGQNNVRLTIAANDGIVEIGETSVYAKIAFMLNGAKRYTLTRLIAVTQSP